MPVISSAAAELALNSPALGLCRCLLLPAHQQLCRIQVTVHPLKPKPCLLPLRGNRASSFVNGENPQKKAEGQESLLSLSAYTEAIWETGEGVAFWAPPRRACLGSSSLTTVSPACVFLACLGSSSPTMVSPACVFLTDADCSA